MTSGVVNAQAGASVGKLKLEHAYVTPTVLDWPVTFPGSNLGDVHLEPGTAATSALALTGTDR